jgi:aldose 1-epimerase
MAITRRICGDTVDGRPVELYILETVQGFEARIATYGATLVSLRVPDRSGALSDVVLGFDTLYPYLGEHPYFGSVIGRYANRIANAAFELDSTVYRLPANDGTHHLHGGPQGFHAALWEAEADECFSGPALTLRRTSVSGEQGYPGNLSVEIRYTLTNENALQLDYSATTDAPTVVNLTNHAYFNLTGGGTVLDHVLRIQGARFLPVDQTLLPRGEALPVRATAFDFTTPARIGQRMAQDHEQFTRGRGYDHCWVLDTAGSLQKTAAELYDPQSGRVMTICTTQPALQFYSGNFLDGSVTGKGGARYVKYAGLCLETQHFPDSPSRPAFPSTVLRPGDVYRHTTVYRFTTR